MNPAGRACKDASSAQYTAQVAPVRASRLILALFDTAEIVIYAAQSDAHHFGVTQSTRTMSLRAVYSLANTITADASSRLTYAEGRESIHYLHSIKPRLALTGCVRPVGSRSCGACACGLATSLQRFHAWENH